MISDAEKLAQKSAFPHNLFIVFNQLEFSNSNKFRLFDSLVGSIFNCNIEVWGNLESKDIELIHCNCFTRSFACEEISESRMSLWRTRSISYENYKAS